MDGGVTLFLLKKGAEAYLYIDDWFGFKVIRKVRVPKSFRVSILDEQLRRFRTVNEAKLLIESRRCGVPTPIVFDVDLLKTTIVMEFIEGELLRDLLPSLSKVERKSICRKIGEYIGLLHSNGIVHGDLTTSNMILLDGKVYFIDFGLGEFTREVEAMGVDLHLMLRALESTHYSLAEECFRSVVDGYSSVFNMAERVLRKVEEIRMRGRYISERRRKS